MRGLLVKYNTLEKWLRLGGGEIARAYFFAAFRHVVENRMPRYAKLIEPICKWYTTHKLTEKLTWKGNEQFIALLNGSLDKAYTWIWVSII